MRAQRETPPMVATVEVDDDAVARPRAAAPPQRYEPIRVLHVGKFYPPHPGGMETVVSEMCAALATKASIEVVVANDNAGTERQEIDGVPVTRLGRWGEILSTSLVPGLIPFLRQDRWDIIHVHHPNPMAMLALLAVRNRASVVVTYHSDIVRQRLTGLLFAPFLERVLARTDRIHVASQELLDSSPVLALHRARTVVVPFGIREERITRLSDRARRVLQELAEWGNGRLALFVGRVVYYKGLEYLLEAMASVDGRLVVVGDGDRLPHARRLATSLGIHDRVRFLGNADADLVAGAFHACDVFVLPSVERSEAFGLVLLEAMAARKPIVTTELPTGVSFINRHNETGLAVPPRDPRALALAITRILNDRELAARMGRAARARFEKDFTVEIAAARILDIYEALRSPREIAPLPHPSVNSRTPAGS